MEPRDNRLTQVFIDRLAALGTPVEHANVPGYRGDAKFYRRLDGALIWLKTNMAGCLLAYPSKDDPGRINLDGPNDFIAFVTPSREGDGETDIYIIPRDVVVPALNGDHERWRHLDGPRKTADEKTSVKPAIWFDIATDKLAHGYAAHFSKYRLPNAPMAGPVLPKPNPTAGRDDLARAIAECKKKIAAIAHRPESAVTISIAW
jgi:hypothetical protein